GTGLAAIADHPVRRLTGGRMMGASIDAVEICALVLELRHERGVHRGQHVLREVAARDPRPIRHDEPRDTGLVETANSLRRSRLESKPPGVVDVAYFFGKRPVTIEEDRGPGSHLPSVR